MIVTLQKISSYFFLALLGLYALDKILLFWGLRHAVLLAGDRALILPLGVLTLIYLFSSIKIELAKQKIENPLYNILLGIFFVGCLALLLFLWLWVKPTGTELL